MPRRPLAFAVAAALAWVAFASSAAADCQPAGPLEAVLPTAPVAFVGTVTAVTGATAKFAVIEVWAGSIGAWVEVRGVTDLPADGIGEDDRRWTVGATYLVLPIPDGGALRDHICSATTEWRPQLEDLRPASARVAPSSADVTIPPQLVAVVLVALLVIAASILAFRRR